MTGRHNAVGDDDPTEGNLQEILDLAPEEQKKLLKLLTHHALGKMRQLIWRGAYVARADAVPGGYEAYDFALDAITKTIEGKRSWNHDVHETLEKHLYSVIDSDINHLVESADNRLGRRLSPPSSSDATTTIYELPGTEPDPLTIVIDKEWQARFHEAAMKELKDDDFLIKLFQCLEAEITDPKEIAVLLETTVDHVNNEKKKLRRKLDKLNNRIKPNKKRTGQ